MIVPASERCWSGRAPGRRERRRGERGRGEGRTRDERPLGVVDLLADQAHSPALVLEHDLVRRRVELAPRRRCRDVVLRARARRARGSARGRSGGGGRQGRVTHVAREVLENVGLERHVDVDGPDDVAQLAVLDLEEALDVLRRRLGSCRARGGTAWRESALRTLCDWSALQRARAPSAQAAIAPSGVSNPRASARCDSGTASPDSDLRSSPVHCSGPTRAVRRRRRLHPARAPRRGRPSPRRRRRRERSERRTFEPRALDPAFPCALEDALALDDEAQPVQVGVLLCELGLGARGGERRAQRVLRVRDGVDRALARRHGRAWVGGRVRE